MNIHTLKLPFAVSCWIRLTTTKPTHTHTRSTTPLRLIHPELLTPAEVGRWVCSGLAGFQGRWHTPRLRPGAAPLCSPPRLQIFSLPRMGTRHPAPHVLTRPKKTGMSAYELHRGGTSVRKRQRDKCPDVCGSQKKSRRDVSGHVSCAEFSHKISFHLFLRLLQQFYLFSLLSSLFLCFFNSLLTFGLPHLPPPHLPLL